MRSKNWRKNWDNKDTNTSTAVHHKKISGADRLNPYNIFFLLSNISIGLGVKYDKNHTRNLIHEYEKDN